MFFFVIVCATKRLQKNKINVFHFIFVTLIKIDITCTYSIFIVRRIDIVLLNDSLYQFIFTR